MVELPIWAFLGRVVSQPKPQAPVSGSGSNDLARNSKSDSNDNTVLVSKINSKIRAITANNRNSNRNNREIWSYLKPYTVVPSLQAFSLLVRSNGANHSEILKLSPP